MIEKSPEVRTRQLRMLECRKAGNKQVALWWMRCAASYRQRDMAPPPYETDWSEGTRDLTRTRYVNG